MGHLTALADTPDEALERRAGGPRRSCNSGTHERSSTLAALTEGIMILDDLNNAARYVNLHPGFRRALNS